MLVLPAVAWCADGVSLGSKISRHMLWIELASGKVWGLTFTCYSSFLCMQELKFISQCFESAQKDSYESIPGHICKHLRWSECKYAHVDTDIELIAGDLERENILSNKVPHKEYQLTDTALQNAAKPIFLALTNRIQAFNLGLDQEALLQVGKKYIGEISDVIAYNYQFHPIEKISIYRRQAMQTFPSLREKFSHFTSDHRFVRLQQSIDSGNPLLPVLSDFFRCSKTVVRYLMGKDFSLIGNDWNGKIEHLADLLNMLKPDFWPETEDDWYHFNLWMKPPFYSLGKPPQKDYSTLLQSALNELAKVGYSRIPSWLERHKVSMTDINTMLDFVRALKEWAEVVGGEPKQASQAFLKLSLLRQAQLNRSWHDWVVSYKDAKKSESGQVENKKDVEDLEWLTFIDEPWLRGQHIVVPLNHSLQLKEEGNKMQHCVGGYVGHCLNGSSHIFSIRNPLTGESLSTVELRLGDNSGVQGEISVGQHYGLKNSAPSDECQCTLTKFLSYLRKKRSDRLCELRRQRLEREERRAIDFRNKVWPQTRIDGFRKLLHGYSALEEIGQKTSEVSAESRLVEKKPVECLSCPPQNQESNSSIMKIIEWLSLMKNSCLHSFNAKLNHCE